MSRPRARQQAALVSIWRFNLAHEITATSLAVLALAAGSWFTMDQLEKRYIELHRGDAERVSSLLQEHLLEARYQLDRFGSLAPERQPELAQLLLPAFSDLYRLGPQHQVQEVLKGSRESRVFAGFSFSGSHIDSYLQQPNRNAAASSLIDRGLEDERASVYFTSADKAGRLLARLDLSYLQDFLKRYTQTSGLPVLLVSKNGFVMLASDGSLRVPAIDLNLNQLGIDIQSGLRHDEQNWLPLVAKNTGLGGHVVILIPAERIRNQQLLVLIPTTVVSGLAILVIIGKNRRLHQRLFRPISRFSEQIERLRANLARTDFDQQKISSVPPRLRELSQIETSFEALMKEIRDRDLSLQQKLRTSLTAAAIAHEINLPLSTIRLRCQQADLQLQQGGLSQEESHQLVRDLQLESQQVSRVIERMRMLLRNVQTDLAPTDLAAVVSNVVTLYKRQLRDNRVVLQREPSHIEPLIVMADAAQLQMAIGNVLRNAIEAVAENTALAPHQRQIQLSLRRQGSVAQVVIADSGRGFMLDPEADTLLTTTKEGGSGLGLFVVRTTLTNHHGELHIGHSESLGGAEVCLELPLASDTGENYQEVPMALTADNT